MITQDEITRFILLSKKQKLNDNDALALSEWVSASEENEAMSRYLSDLYDDSEVSGLYQSIDLKAGYRKISSKIQGDKTIHRNISAYRKWIAAAAIIPFLLISYVWINSNKHNDFQSFNDIKHGGPKAVLEINNIGKIVLQADKTEKIRNKNGIVIGEINNNTFICSKFIPENNESSTMAVPAGGEYKIILSDGTKAWVNSESRLQYPYAFNIDKRSVKLDGEAYFDVVKNEKQPFEVITRNAVITDLGTKFNVCSYANDDFEQITLEEGLVSVKYNGQEFKLEPGMQLKIDTKNNKAEVNTVDVNQYISWKDGLFRFQEMNLSELTNKIQRWYGIDFAFKDESCRNSRFTGAVSRNTGFKDFIGLIESTTDVKFELKNNKINVKKK